MQDFHIYLYGPAQGPIDTTFEDAAERLQRLDRLAFEPDGSFVWARNGGRQKVFGMLYDAANQIQYVELRGQVDLETFQTIVKAISNDQIDDLAVMKLPERQLQQLQDFEESTFC